MFVNFFVEFKQLIYELFGVFVKKKMNYLLILYSPANATNKLETAVIAD